jgi:hypothetical protein
MFASHFRQIQFDTMSLLDDASLLVTPNAYKEGKLYSVIPSNGNGDFSVTRATTATRVNAAGLVELVPYNLLTYSEDLTNAIWTKVRSSVSANTTTAPNGTLTADTLTANGVFGSHEIAQSLSTTSGNTYAFSVYAKKDTNDFIQILGSGAIVGINAWANFDLNNGIVGLVAPSATATITSVGNGWYRCTMNATAIASTTGSFVIPLVASATSGRGESNSLATSVFLWGAQFNEGALLDYQMTETRLNIPRLDYSLGSCPNILLEPQRTNLALRSEEFDNSTVWATNINGTGVAPIRTANSVISPSGVQNADSILLNRGAGNTTTDQCNLIQFITVATTGTYYFSVWMKATTSGDIGKQVFIRCGNTASLQAVTLTATWTRYETTATVTLGSNQFQIGNRGTFTASNSVSVDLWGAQIEAGAYATSYIPTTSASVTRNADVISRGNIFTNGLITASGGTWFVDIRNNRVLTRDSTGVNIYLATNTGVSDGFLFATNPFGSRLRIVRNPGFNILFDTTTDTAKIAIKWNGTTADIFANGVKVVSNHAYTQTLFQALGVDGGGVPKYINSMALFPTPLTDTQCIALTT